MSRFCFGKIHNLSTSAIKHLPSGPILLKAIQKYLNLHSSPSSKISRFNLRQRPPVSYYEPEQPNLDEYVFCSDCGDYVYEYCSIHGPLLVVPDDKVPPKPDVPSFVPRAALTIPHVFLHINYSTIPDAGLGIFTTLTLPRGVRFGPYRGKRTDEIGSSYCWQVRGANNRASHVVDASDANSSNWMRYVNCSRHWYEQNLVAYQYRGQIYYRTIKIIPRFTELMVFYGSEFACELGIDLKKYNSPSSFAQKLGTQIPKTAQIKCTPPNNQEEIIEKSSKQSYKANDHKKSEVVKPDVNNNSNIKNKKKKGTLVKTVRLLSKNSDLSQSNMNMTTTCVEKKLAHEDPKMNSSSKLTIEKEAHKTDTNSENSKNNLSSEFTKDISIKTGLDFSLADNSCKLIKDTSAYVTEPTNSPKVSNSSSALRKYNDFPLESGSKSTNNTTDVNNNYKRNLITKYTCDICSYVTNRKNLENHLLLHGNIKGIKFCKCKYCLNVYKTKSGLRTHELTHTGKVYACDICKHAFSHSGNLKSHKRIHAGEKPYTCDICKRAFSHSGNLTSHKRIHTAEKPYTWDICKHAFTRNYALTIHKRIHTAEKPYTCDICKRAFSGSSHLTIHKRIHTAEKPYTCDICKRAFSQHGSLTRHKRFHTGEKPYTCDICKRAFSQHSNLTTHKRMHTAEKPYTCDICKRAFSQHGSLTRHKRFHTGEKPYTCDICKRAFSHSGNLTSHKRIHTAEKPYICDICKRAFSQHGSLTTHKRIHTGEKPYICDIRKRPFSDSSHLTIHKRIHTGK